MHCSPCNFRLSNWLMSAVCLMLSTTASAADWPTFRGTDRTAVAPDTDLLEEWPEGGPRLLWTATGAGRGYASVAIAGDKIFTLGDNLSAAPDANEYLSCFDRTTGQRVWIAPTGEPWNNGQDNWQGSRSTPTVDDGIVYVLTPHGRLVGCIADTGQVGKVIDLKATFGGTKGDSWGYSESVLIDGDRLVCTPGGQRATMVALDKKTGRQLWTCSFPDDRGAGHASIVISEVGGKRVYVQTTASGAFGVDAETGRLLWSYPIDKTTAVIPTPIVRDDLVYMVAGYKRGGALLRQIPEGNGGVTIEEVYGLKPELANKHGGVVLVGNHLYGCADDKQIIICADLETGETVWKERGSGKNSVAIAAADGHLYLRYQDGTMALAKADPSGFVEVSSFQIPGSGDRPSWAHPVILDGRLYLREGDTILCYDIQQR
jgi:outer membrane protein assembly factor BamB